MVARGQAAFFERSTSGFLHVSCGQGSIGGNWSRALMRLREKKIVKMTRRHLLGGDLRRLGNNHPQQTASAAAEFEFKLGVNTPDTHPLTLRLIEAAHAIGTQSSGRLNVTVFPNTQLGGDPEMLSQLRAGGIELLAAPS
jgi:hypothetical protein